MSIRTTHKVTRDFAIQAILKKQLERMAQLNSMSDSELEDLLEETIHNGFYNFNIVSEDDIEREKQKEYSAYLDDINNLPDYNDAQ